jgi:CheY-like chemotaxis protein
VGAERPSAGDVRLPDGSGVEACRTIREARPETKVIMLTSYAAADALFASIIAGASGYLLKQTRGQAVVDVITTVASGRSLLDPDVTGKVLERIRESRAEDPAIAALTGSTSLGSSRELRGSLVCAVVTLLDNDRGVRDDRDDCGDCRPHRDEHGSDDAQRERHFDQRDALGVLDQQAADIALVYELLGPLDDAIDVLLIDVQRLKQGFFSAWHGVSSISNVL